ncbi:hypothetical protein BJF85_05225 [Saccharomonospora sp. CUA-673]|uniref:TetR/AcrR family transcriptional regulator n=1 Tax=Saccharomonospora sp. CUA-673 TaxID=1904969 RepID=UPI00096168EA|nr:TetR family transcriptional regulator [Saccharomonospora sp. CUA-673]OLT40581.1 hypothetical protein BJF85_05225 [Saccharomonospora sp. CUA-673]
MTATEPHEPDRAATATGSTSRGESRQKQIIEATIETISELGFARTTYTRIAERGGLSSTRLISYHFADKADLMQAVISDVYASINEFLLERMAIDPATRPIQPPTDRPLPQPESAAAELSAYITAVVDYVGTHQARLSALRSIFAAVHDDPDNPEAAQADPRGGVMSYLIGVLERGQATGEFRRFDPLVVAGMIQRPLEALPLLLRSRPDLDMAHYAAELATAIDCATRQDGRQ